jgi:hypothetical protein
MSFSIPEPIARAFAAVLAKIPEALAAQVVELFTRIASSPSPKDALARALQVTAHEHAADAVLDAAFAAKRHVPGSGV